MRIELDLDQAQVDVITKVCLLRITKRAAELIEDSTADGNAEADDCILDLNDYGPVFEAVRSKLVNAIFAAQKAAIDKENK